MAICPQYNFTGVLRGTYSFGNGGVSWWRVCYQLGLPTPSSFIASHAWPVHCSGHSTQRNKDDIAAMKLRCSLEAALPYPLPSLSCRDVCVLKMSALPDFLVGRERWCKNFDRYGRYKMDPINSGGLGGPRGPD